MAAEIIRINPDMHVCGMSHAFSFQESPIKQPLYQRLENPARIKLRDAGNG